MRKKFLEEPKFILIPVVDVLLAVFLFLAVLAFNNTFVSLPLELPQGRGAALEGKVLNVFVDADGNLYLDGRKVTFTELLGILKGRKAEAVNLFADKKTSYGAVVELLNKLRENGVYAVNLVLKKRG
jgi:biopolymer transport protein ExbD